MFSNLIGEPIENGSELDEGEERDRELVVAGAGAAEAFDPAEEIFDVMAAAVVTAMKADVMAAIGAWGKAHPRAALPQGGAQRIGIEALVGMKKASNPTSNRRIKESDPRSTNFTGVCN